MSATIVQPKPQRRAFAGVTSSMIAVALITAAGTGLRFLHLGIRSLWFDEAISVALARLNWLDLRKALMNREANMSLYYVLLHYWVSLGASEYFVRSLSVLIGAATIPLIYMLGKRLFGTRAGLTAAALLALNGYHVRYSQEARSYSLVVLLVVLSSLLFVEAVEGGSRRVWKWYTAVAILAAYAHFFACLVIVAQFASVLLVRRSNAWTTELKRSGLGVGVGCFPLAWFVAFKDKGQIDWVPRPSLQGVYQCLFDFAGHGGNPLLAVYTAAALVAIIGGFFAVLRLSAAARWRRTLVALWLLLPLGLTLAVSFHKPLFLPRYLIIVLPALVLLVAVALDWLRPRAAYAAALALVLLLSISGVKAVYGQGYDPDRQYWREATQYIITNSRPGDTAIFYHPFGRVAFEYYRGMLSAPDERPRVAYPLRGDGVLVASATASQARLLASDSPVMQDVAKQQRVWFVLSVEEDEQSKAVQSWLQQHFPVVHPHRFHSIRFFLYSK